MEDFIWDKYRKRIAEAIKAQEEDITIEAYDSRGVQGKYAKSTMLLSKISWTKGENFFISHLQVRYKATVVSVFHLYQLPFCCGIMVSCGSHVNDHYRKKGIATILNELRQEIGKALGFSLILCTDKVKNTPQRKLLEKNGWSDIYKFVNKRTTNELAISVKSL